MTIKEAYRSLDLAPGLGRERVQNQFESLIIDLNKSLSQAKSPNLKVFYSSRLKEIQVAKEILDQNFDFIEVKTSDASKIHETVDMSDDNQSSSTATHVESTPDEIKLDNSPSDGETMAAGVVEDVYLESESISSSIETEPIDFNKNANQIEYSAKKKFLKFILFVVGGVFILLIIFFVWNLIDSEIDPFRHLPNERYVLVDKLNMRESPQSDARIVGKLLYGTRIVEVESNVGSEEGFSWSRVAVYDVNRGWENPDTVYIAVSECGQPWVVDSSSFYRFNSLFDSRSMIDGMRVQRRYALVNYLNNISSQGVNTFKLISVEDKNEYVAFNDFPDPRKLKNCFKKEQDAFAVIFGKENNSKVALFFKFETDSSPKLVKSIELGKGDFRFNSKIYNAKKFGCYHGGLVLQKFNIESNKWKVYNFFYFDKNNEDDVDLQQRFWNEAQ